MRVRLDAAGLLALTVLAVPGAVPAAAAAEAVPLLGYEGYATAPAFEIRFSSDQIPVDPVFDGRLPEATAEMSSGSTHGLASIFWPGAPGGNLGTTVQQLNRLCLPNVPGACLDIPAEVKRALAPANDPVKAEVAFPGGPTTATFPPGAPSQPVGALVATGKADEHGVTTEGTLGSFSLGGSITGAAKGTASTTVTKAVDKVTSTATSTLTGLSIAGLVRIGAVTSTATASSDGTSKATTAGTTTVTGMTVAGLPVTVDDRGLHLAGSTTGLRPALDPAVKAAEAALAELGFKAFVAKPALTANGPQGSAEAGALVLRFLLQGQAVEVSLGNARATVDASPGFDESLGPAGDPGPGAAAGDPGTGASDAVVGDPEAGAAAGGGELGTPGSTPTAGTGRSRGVGALRDLLPGSGGIAVGIAIAGLLAVGAIAAGLRSLSNDLLAADATACPSEGRAPP